MNRESAISSVRAAAVCGVVSFAVTTLTATAAAIGGSFELEGMRFSAWTFVDSIIIGLFTLGMFFRWRWCAIGMALYFAVSKYVSFKAELSIPGYVSGLVMLFFYLDGMRGAVFLYRDDLKLAAQVRSLRSSG